MTIKAISTTELHDECNGCGALNIVGVPSLVAGFPYAPDAIVLPSCGSCGAITALQGEPHDTPENRQHLFDTEQHGAINALRAQLVAHGQIHTGITQDEIDRVSGERLQPARRMMPLDAALAVVRSVAEEFPDVAA